MRNNIGNDSMNVTPSSHHAHAADAAPGISWATVRLINQRYWEWVARRFPEELEGAGGKIKFKYGKQCKEN